MEVCHNQKYLCVIIFGSFNHISKGFGTPVEIIGLLVTEINKYFQERGIDIPIRPLLLRFWGLGVLPDPGLFEAQASSPEAQGSSLSRARSATSACHSAWGLGFRAE